MSRIHTCKWLYRFHGNTKKDNLLNINHRELVAMETDVIFRRPPTKRTQNKNIMLNK